MDGGNRMRVHFIKGKDSDIAFLCDTLEIFKVTPEERKRLESQKIMGEKYPELVVDEAPDYFSTLILHVSNACNMKCAYCFANHGSYGSNEGLMSEKTALQAVDVYYGRYKRIKQIKFFGGEPLMNVPVIEAVCRHVGEKYGRGEIQGLPEYKIVTNGSIMTDMAMEVIKNYDIQVVFSMDGPQEIHDYARIFSDGSGSFEKIRGNFRKLRDHTGGKQPYGVEMTYTAIHRQHGMSMKDVTEFFVTEFQVEARNVNISPVSADDGSIFALKDQNYCLIDSAKEILSAMENGQKDCLDQKLYFLIKKIKAGVKSDRQVCNAAWKWSAVSASGNVYPCLMFMDRDEYMMGNIYEDLFHDSRYQKLTDTWSHYDRFQKPSCRNCFANNLCINCMGQNMDASGSVYEKPVKQCDAMRKLMEVVIEGIAEGVF